MASYRILNDSKAAIEFEILCELIKDVYSEFININWSKRIDEEIGFYDRDKKTKSSVFFGIWYESWKVNKIPLSIVVDYTGKAPVEKFRQIQKYVDDLGERSLTYKNFQDFAVVLIDFEYFNYEDDVTRISDLIVAISKVAQIDN